MSILREEGENISEMVIPVASILKNKNHELEIRGKVAEANVDPNKIGDRLIYHPDLRLDINSSISECYWCDTTLTFFYNSGAMLLNCLIHLSNGAAVNLGGLFGTIKEADAINKKFEFSDIVVQFFEDKVRPHQQLCRVILYYREHQEQAVEIALNVAEKSKPKRERRGKYV